MKLTPTLIYTFEQRSDEWFRARLGKITSTRAQRAFDPSKHKALAVELVRESISPEIAMIACHATDGIPALEWGREREEAAKAALAIEGFNVQEPPGFVSVKEIDILGDSPDGLVDGAPLEIKCPMTPDRHHQIINGGWRKFFPQLMHHGVVMNADRVLFASFCLEADNHLWTKWVDVPADWREQYLSRVLIVQDMVNHPHTLFD